MSQKLIPTRLVRSAAMMLLAASAITVAACGAGGSGQPTTAQVPLDTEAPAPGAVTIRFALPSEPLWQWLVDSGTLAAWEAEHGLRIEASHPFRPFAALVSGHADIILIDALDVPVFSEGLGSDPAIIGRYASDRSIAATKRTSQATDLAGVVEGQIAMESQLGSTLLWSLIVEQAHSLDLSEDSRDFDFILATSGVADTVERGAADACICLPDASVASLSTGMLRPLYDGKPASQIYAELAGLPEHQLLGEVFLAEREWFRAHRDEVAAFLELWETAVQHWHAHYPELIAAYPELLSVQTQEHVDWLTHRVTAHNWIVPTVHITEANALAYLDAIARLSERGQLPADTRVPAIITTRTIPAGGE